MTNIIDTDFVDITKWALTGLTSIGPSYGYGLECIVPTGSGTFENTTDILANLLHSTIEFKVRFPTTGDATKFIKLSFVGNSRNEIIFTIYSNGKLETESRVGTSVIIPYTYSPDTDNGDVFRLVTDHHGIMRIYLNGVHDETAKIGIIRNSASSTIVSGAIYKDPEFFYLKINDQEIYYPDDIPNSSISNGTYYFSTLDVRNAGDFRTKWKVSNKANDTTFNITDGKEFIEQVISVYRHDQATALVKLTRVEESPGAGQYAFFAPDTMVVGDTPTSATTWWIDGEVRISNERIDSTRKELQAWLDSILASRKTPPMAADGIYDQVKLRGAKLCALWILKQIWLNAGKDTTGVNIEISKIEKYFKETTSFTVDGGAVSLEDYDIAFYSSWQDGHLTTEEELLQEWRDGYG